VLDHDRWDWRAIIIPDTKEKLVRRLPGLLWSKRVPASGGAHNVLSLAEAADSRLIGATVAVFVAALAGAIRSELG
jgi:hypothetical protein